MFPQHDIVVALQFWAFGLALPFRVAFTATDKRSAFQQHRPFPNSPFPQQKLGPIPEAFPSERRALVKKASGMDPETSSGKN